MSVKTRYVNHYDADGNQTSVLVRIWNTQPKPYNAPLPLSTIVGYLVKSSGFDSPDGSNNLGPSDFRNTDLFVHAQNQAYDKLQNAIGDKATWANNVIELSESVSTVEKRGTQLLKFANALRKGRFGDAAKALDVKPPKSAAGMKKLKHFGDQFLEYHLGWEPAIQDVGAALNTMQKPLGGHKVHGQSHYKWQYHYRDGDANDYYKEDIDIDVTVKYSMNVTVDNPNLFLANQMGVVNPLSVAWEAVPYSFVVDWFSNVGQCLSAMTDGVGISTKNAYTTSFQTGSRSTATGNHFWAPGSTAHSDTGKSIYLTRALGIPGPTLEIKPFKGFSPVRAATAISLLLQKL